MTATSQRHAGRPRKYNYNDPETFETRRGRQAFNSHIARLGRELDLGINAYVRRYVCIVCCGLYSKRDIMKATSVVPKDVLLKSQNFAHLQFIHETFPNLSPILYSETPGSNDVVVYACASWCWRRFRSILNTGREVRNLPVCPTLAVLRPLQNMPEAIRKLRRLEFGALSLLDLSVNLGGGLEKGYYLSMNGDMRVDEDLAGTAGSVVGQLKLDEDANRRILLAMNALKTEKHPLIEKYRMTGERDKYGIGIHMVREEDILQRGVEARGEPEAGLENTVTGHLIARKEQVRRRQMRSRSSKSLRAGVAFCRDQGIPKNIFWSDDIEVMLFPYMYCYGYGGFEWTSTRGIVWEEHVEKRLWNVNPLFRYNSLYIVYLFDYSEKCEMHRAPTRCFIPDEVRAEDAEEFTFMSEANARCMESVFKKDLARGRRAIASASECLGKPNVFQTETMNLSDMEELKTCSFRLYEHGPLCIDDVSTATLYKYRQIVIMEKVLPATGMKGVEYGSIRLEIQSGRSYRLHAHNILRVTAKEQRLFECITASLRSLPKRVRERYAPLSRHHCLPYKCKDGVCVYGYPVLEASEETKRVVTEEGLRNDKIIYKREVGQRYFSCRVHGAALCNDYGCLEENEEMDERVTPFCSELTNVRNCHGTFLVCDDELATGYAGKYAFKRSGGMGVESGRLNIRHALTHGEAQLLQSDKDIRVTQAMKEYLSVRTVSMMEMCLHLCQESVVYSTFYLRELWVVLPHERKKYIDGGKCHQGVPGGAQLRDYYNRRECYSQDSFEAFYGRGEVQHASDKEWSVRCGGRSKEGHEFVYVGKEEKRLISRIMPIRGDGRRFAELCSWCAILQRIPHRAVSEVWDMNNAEDLWNAAARCGALGGEYVTCRATVALIRVLQMTMERELEFCTKMGMRELEKDNVKCAFERAAETVMRVNLRTTELIACNQEGERGERVMMPVRNDVFLPDQHTQSECTSLPDFEILAIRQWRDRFRARGWVITDDDLGISLRGRSRSDESEAIDECWEKRSVILDVPEEVKKELRRLSCYPSQARACLEILDAIVRTHRGVKRFITGAAGRGKSFLKKILIRILRSAGLTVKVLAVAAIVAQDDEGGQGSTIASAFNKRASDSTFDKLALNHAKTDVIFFDEISLASGNDARTMTEFLSRGQYMRTEGFLLNAGSRKRRRGSNMLYADEDPYFGAKIIAIGDFMQLEPPGGDPIYASERLWGSVFRQNTLFLQESVRSSDPALIHLCDLCRSFSGHNVDVGREIVQIIRSRSVRNMCELSLGTTVLSPRFQRAQEFSVASLVEMNNRESLCDRYGWSTEVYNIRCDDYVVKNRKIRLEDCVGMDDDDALEAKRSVLDKDHTRLRKFVFRLGMTAVVTENGPRRASEIMHMEEQLWPEDAEALARNTTSSEAVEKANMDIAHDRLLNGERVKVTGLVKRRGGEVCGVKLQSSDGRWQGERVMRKKVSKGQGLNTSSIRESRSVKFVRDGKEELGTITRSQVPLVLDIGLTVHKAQGMTLEYAAVDMGCDSRAYVGGLFYTAITRVKKLAEIWFIDAPTSDEALLRAVKSSERARLEMKRCQLESKDLEERSFRVLEHFRDILDSGE